MDEYIKREAIIEELEEEIQAGDVSLDEEVWINKGLNIALQDIKRLPASDVQPLSVVAEHIKNRLYETALNTNGAESDTIAAMAERIDFWIDELKEGNTK